jgi:hypothetical protein
MLSPTENRTFRIEECKKIRIGRIGIYKQRHWSMGSSGKRFNSVAWIYVN